MRAGIAASAVVGLMLSLSSCGPFSSTPKPSASASTTTAKTLTVVASVNQWGSLAQEIGGSDVSVTSILNSTSVDAHNFEPTASDVARLRTANVIVANGAGYDSWALKTHAADSLSVSAAETVGAMTGDNPHLWFSKDARKSVATELAEVFTKARPEKKKDFHSRLLAWEKSEDSLERSLSAFAKRYPKSTYAATEAVAYYLMSDMGFKDLTPEQYAQSMTSGGEPSASDLQTFQKLIEQRGIDLLVNNTQEATDSAATLTGAAGRSEIPVISVSEQMPAGATTLDGWIQSLVTTISTTVQKRRQDKSAADSTASPSATASNSSQRSSGK
jgi:zinc/manganese transport system substrate-binding protein